MGCADWYVELQGLTTGPYTSEKIIEWAEARQLVAEDRIFSASQKIWKNIRDIESLRSHIPAALNIENFTSSTPIKYSPPPTKKNISWREKKRKFWELRRTEEKVHAAFLNYKHKSTLKIDPANAGKPGALSLKNTAIGLPSRPSDLDQKKQAQKNELKNDENVLFSLMDDLQEFQKDKANKNKTAAMGKLTTPQRPVASPIHLTEASNKDTGTDYLNSESNFHKVLFIGFLSLSLIFAGFSYWLNRRNPTATENVSDSPQSITNVEKPSAVHISAPVSDSPQTASNEIVIKDGVVQSTQKNRGSPVTTNPTNPHTLTPPQASNVDSIPTLKPPRRPKRD